jgi:MarR family transcriptional regulator, organic hydroperoxide resistance regulator
LIHVNLLEIPMSKDPAFLEHYLTFLLAKTSHLVSTSFHGELRERGVSVGTWRILCALNESRRTVGELAELVLLKQSTLSKTLDRLERDGLIERRRDAQHRRLVIIGNSKKGKRLVGQLLPLAQQHERNIFSHLSDAERGKLAELLRGTIEQVELREGLPPAQASR